MSNGQIIRDKVETEKGVKSVSTKFSFSETIAFDHALAGIGAGAIATLILHPLDLIKIRFQGIP
jgi:hypothetical protein